jgi:predicted neuraminidase
MSMGPQSWRVLSARFLLPLVTLIFLISWDAYFRASPGDALAVWAAEQSSVPPLALQASGHIPMPPGVPAAHASNLVTMPSASPYSVLAFWFAGSRESAPDVGIAASAFDRSSQSWGTTRMVVNREDLGQLLGFGVRRLGNPVAWLDSDHQLHVFVVATGLGGWAASRILHLKQKSNALDFGELAFETVRLLPLSWLWNTSFLVRSAPLALQDGGMVLPVHFELGIKYPVALRFDQRAGFGGMARISGRKHLLQPTLVMQGERHWLALMRDQRSQGHISVAQTLDGGQNWHDLPDLSLVNPDASVAGLGLSPKLMVLAYNSTANSRAQLDLAQSSDGENWSLLRSLAQGSGKDEYSYPALVWAEGSLWVSYTDQRKRIAWQRFGKANP